MFNIGGRADDMCPGLAVLVLTEDAGGYCLRENLDILHKKNAFSCIFIFVHIGMILDVKTVMAIGNKRYSHFSAQKHETIMQNIGEGAYTMLSLNQTIGWTYHPCRITLVSAPMRR